MASARAVQHCGLGQRVLVARRRAGRGHWARDRAETASQHQQRRHAVAVDGTTSGTSVDGRRARGRARPSGDAIRRRRDHTRRRAARRRQHRYRRSSDDGDQARRAALDAEQRRAKPTKGPIAGPLDRVDGRSATWTSTRRASVPIRRGLDGSELRCRGAGRRGAWTAADLVSARATARAHSGSCWQAPACARQPGLGEAERTGRSSGSRSRSAASAPGAT